MFRYLAPTDDKGADIILMSSDGAGFRAHRNMLWHASSQFADTVPEWTFVDTSLDVVVPEPLITVDDKVAVTSCPSPPLVTMQLPDLMVTLKPLLRLCYPVADPSFSTIFELASVMDAAFKYDMKRAQVACARALLEPDMLSTSPFDVYAVAHRHKLARETRLAAKNTLKYAVQWSSPMPVQLGSVTGSAVYELLRYRERCKASVLDAIRDSIWWDTLGDVQYYPCFTCDPDAEENESTRQYSMEVEECLRITHRLVSNNPCGSDALREKILANMMVLVPCDSDLLSRCSTGDCRERIVDALLSVHVEVMLELDRAIRGIELQLRF